MIKIFTLLMIFATSGFIVAQNNDPTPASSKQNSDKNLFNEDVYFSINFKGQPNKQVQDIQTEGGTVVMVQYMLKGKEFVKMVARASYPPKYAKNNIADSLLKNSMEGFIKSLNLTLESQKTIKYSNFPGLLFKASSQEYFAVVVNYLIENTLYQIGIIQNGRYPAESEITNFIFSFKLK